MAIHKVQPIQHTNGKRVHWNDKNNRNTVKAPMVYVDAGLEADAILLAKEKSGLGRFKNWSFHHMETLGTQKCDFGRNKEKGRKPLRQRKPKKLTFEE